MGDVHSKCHRIEESKWILFEPWVNENGNGVYYKPCARPNCYGFRLE